MQKIQSDIRYEYDGGTIMGEEHFSSDDDLLSTIILKALLDTFA